MYHLLQLLETFFTFRRFIRRRPIIYRPNLEQNHRVKQTMVEAE